MGGDALAEKSFGSEGACGVTEGADRDDKTDLLERKNGQEGEESERHQGHAGPHPGQARGLQQEAENRTRAEVVDFADAFHGPADAELAAGSGDDNEKKEDGFAHARELPWRWEWCWARCVPRRKLPRKLQ